MKILAIESATNTASVCIADKDDIISNFTLNTNKTHSETLVPLIDNMLNGIKMDIGEIDYIAITSGPGSYTGLRIGAAAAKAISFSMKLQGKSVPIIPISTLEALAFNYIEEENYICSILDAKAKRVYASLLKRKDDYNFENVLKDDVYKIKDLLDILPKDKKIRFVGDTHILQEEIKENENFISSSKYKNNIEARNIALLSIKKIENKETIDCDEFVPKYMIKSSAEQQSIRNMKEEDLEIVSKIESSSIKTPWKKESFKEALNDKNTMMIVSAAGNKVKGYAVVWLSKEEASLSNIAVDKEFRRLNIGTSLLKYIKNELLKLNIKELYLEVRKSNDAAINLYKKNGFKIVGERKNFYENPREDALLMKLEI